jgi:hypothetical protein
MSSEKNSTGLIILDAKGQPINGDVLESLVPAHNGHDDKFALNLYQGIASGSFSEESKKILAENVIKSDVQIRPDGIIYLPGVQFRNCLNRAFGPGAWAVYPLRQFMDALRIYYEGALIVNSRYIAQAVGECEFHANNKMQSYASAIEAAKTDCITRCCKDLGIAEQLWDPNFIRAWKEEFAEMVEVHHKRDPETCWIWKRKDQRLQYPYKNLTAEEQAQRKPRQSTGKQQPQQKPEPQKQTDLKNQPQVEDAKIVEETKPKNTGAPDEEKISPSEWTNLCKAALGCINPNNKPLGVSGMFDRAKKEFNITSGTQLTGKQMEKIRNEWLPAWEKGLAA